MKIPLLPTVIFLSLFVSCTEEKMQEGGEGLKIARLGEGDTSALAAIRNAFSNRNPGYDLQYFHQVRTLPEAEVHRLVFVQRGGGTAALGGGQSSKVSVGDLISLEAGQGAVLDSLMDLLAFTVPEPLPEGIPGFVRPDWDPNITDLPGGCATETGAYRRILLTWLGKNGPYLYHGLNAHRVRIMDSFTHYHPKDGGFDEFYLVQMAMPGAKIISSERVDLITNPNTVTPEEAAGLLRTTELHVGDLVYLPRGVAHRGLDGVLAQVITVPGFIPGSEIGLDHHLKAINEKLGLDADAALPYNRDASEMAVVK